MGALHNKESPPVFAYISIFILGVLTAASLEVLSDFVIGSNQREVLRVTSPDRQVDAVFVEPRIHALGDAALYVVPKGEPVPARGPQLRGAMFKELPRLVLPRAHLLQVNYRWGCISRFTNLWHSYDLDNGNYYVELLLNPGTDFSCIDSASGSTARNH